MFERFSENAIKVVMIAQEEARRLGHNFVGTEQLLLGLIGLGTGISTEAFRSFQINLLSVRREVENVIGRGDGLVAVEIPFTRRAKRAMEIALEQSRLLQDCNISDEHLLLGVLAQEEAVGVQVIRNLGVMPAQLHARVLELRGNPEPISEESIVSRVRLARVREDIDPIIRQLREVKSALVSAQSKIKECADDIDRSEKPAASDVRTAAAAISTEFKELKELLDGAPFLMSEFGDIEKHLRRIHSPKKK